MKEQIESGNLVDESISKKDKLNLLTALIPDANGNIWFTSRQGVIGLIHRTDKTEDDCPKVYASFIGLYASLEKIQRYFDEDFESLEDLDFMKDTERFTPEFRKQFRDHFMIDEDTDSLILKTDDGTVSFSYPLDETITNTVLSLEYDGYNLWTMENTATDQMTVKRWYINNYVCTLRNTFDFIPSGSHKFSSNAFTIEHYHTAFSSYEGAGSSVLSVNDGSKMDSGYVLVLGPNNNGQVEEVVVSSAAPDHVNINGTTQYNHELGTPISFYKNIWLFNDYSGVDGSTGALYKFSAYTGS